MTPSSCLGLPPKQLAVNENGEAWSEEDQPKSWLILSKIRTGWEVTLQGAPSLAVTSCSQNAESNPRVP